MRFPCDSTMSECLLFCFDFPSECGNMRPPTLYVLGESFFYRRAKVFYRNVLKLIKPILSGHLHFMDLIVFLDKCRKVITNIIW